MNNKEAKYGNVKSIIRNGSHIYIQLYHYVNLQFSLLNVERLVEFDYWYAFWVLI